MADILFWTIIGLLNKALSELSQVYMYSMDVQEVIQLVFRIVTKALYTPWPFSLLFNIFMI